METPTESRKGRLGTMHTTPHSTAQHSTPPSPRPTTPDYAIAALCCADVLRVGGVQLGAIKEHAAVPVRARGVVSGRVLHDRCRDARE